jgi:Alpha/beta hydrolase domain
MPPLQAVFAKYKLTGPILPDGAFDIGLGTGVPIPGYKKSEFFVAGTARSYTPTLPLPTDGKLVVTADPEIAAGNYKTRLVVLRPTDPTKFNGTVIVEWLNVTAGADIATDFMMARNEFIRSGYAYVGVSAQAVGVNNLKNTARYASLLHPGDSYSYDIFTRAGWLVGLEDSPLLGGLTADRVIAAGESQSASRMVTYINAVQPIENVYDGFMVHSRSGSGASIRQLPLSDPSITYPSPAPIRDDLGVPVMVVQAEGDVIGSRLAARQPDTALFRAWEMAGTAHADAYTVLSDPGDGSGAVTMFGYLRTPPNPFGCVNPINAGGHHWILQAAFHGLDTWVRTGVAPPVGPPLEVDAVLTEAPWVVLERDVYGNALGGVRSPHVDAPVATLDSENSGVFFCRLFGRTVPFSVAEINNLYTSKEDFLTQWLDSINANVAAGFLLQADSDELQAAAESWDFPN